jgi:hypothetical protein
MKCKVCEQDHGSDTFDGDIISIFGTCENCTSQEDLDYLWDLGRVSAEYYYGIPFDS